MAGALSPVVHRTTNYLSRIAWPYFAGHLAGGVLLGLLLALMSASLHVAAAKAHVALAMLVAAYALADLARWNLWRPNLRRQVSQDLLRTKYLSTTSFIFGLDLGNGWTTVQPTSALVIFCLAATALDPHMAFAAGVAFAAARALHLLLGWRLGSVDDLPRRFRLRAPLSDAIRTTTGVVGLITVAALAMS